MHIDQNNDLRDSAARFRVALAQLDAHGWTYTDRRSRRTINPAVYRLRSEIRAILAEAKARNEALRTRFVIGCGYLTLGLVVLVLRLWLPAPTINE